MAKPKAIGGLGLRDFQLFNVALLAKIGWRLLQNPECLLAKVLFGKYCPDKDILHATGSSAMSHGWRSILLGRDLLVQNLGWAVGNVESINVWDDPWLSLSRQQRPVGPPNEPHSELRVADLLNSETSEWELSKIRLILPAYEEAILSIKPSLTRSPDKLIWLGTKSGDYTTKSGYYSAVNNDDFGVAQNLLLGFNWKSSVWNLSCSPKVKLFSWKLLKGAIPVGERLMERHIPIDPLCKRCGSSESITHLLFHCRYAQRVWQLAPFTTDLDTSGIIDLQASWDYLCKLKCLPPTGLTSGSLVPWILWLIWKARNKFVFEGHSSEPEDTLSMAIVLAREWNSEQRKDPIARTNLTPPLAPPPPATVVVRTDAAWASSTHDAGLGWVLLGNPGTQSFSKSLKCVSSVLAAEGLALREAVRSCADRGMKKVAFESDSAQLIKAINLSAPASELYAVTADIHSFISAFEFVSFSWIPRERNCIADDLAKNALFVAGTMVVGDAFIAPN